MASLRQTNGRLNAITDFYDDAPPPADGPFHGVPYVIKQLMADCAGHPTTLGSTFFAKTARRRCRQRRRGAHAARWPGDRRPHQHQRIWPGADHRAGVRRPDDQSLASGSVAGRLVRRLGGDRRGARPADGPRHRRRRLDPYPGEPVWPVRAEAVARPGQPCADRRDLGRGRRAALRVDLGAGQRRLARRRCRRRAGRSLSLRRQPTARSSTRRRARRAGCAWPSCEAMWAAGARSRAGRRAIERTAKLLRGARP